MRKDGQPRKPRERPRDLTSKAVEVGGVVECLSCDYYLEAPNALAVGSIHARSDGHTVVASRTVVIRYN